MRATPLLAALLLVSGPAAAPLSVPPAGRDLAPDPDFVLDDSVRAQLSVISDIALSPDGSLYLADRTFPAVLHLEPTGHLRRIIGRAGEGPGEFIYISQLGTIHDTLWAVDPGLGRVTLFGPGAREAATVTLGRPAALRAGVPEDRRLRSGLAMAMLPDGGVIAEQPITPPGRPAAMPIALAVLRVDRDNAIRDTLTVLNADRQALRFIFREGILTAAQPLTDDPTAAYASDGGLVVRLDRRAGAGSFTLTAWRDGAEQAWTRSLSYRPAPVPAGLPDSLARMLVRRDPGAAPTPITADSIRRKLYVPPSMPPVEAIVVGHDRSIWLRVHFADSPADRADWMLVDARGRPVRRVTTDPRFRVLEADRAHLWGTLLDLDDVPQVVRYTVPQEG